LGVVPQLAIETLVLEQLPRDIATTITIATTIAAKII